MTELLVDEPGLFSIPSEAGMPIVVSVWHRLLIEVPNMHSTRLAVNGKI
jgi:hypothetical protein